MLAQTVRADQADVLHRLWACVAHATQQSGGATLQPPRTIVKTVTNTVAPAGLAQVLASSLRIHALGAQPFLPSHRYCLCKMLS